MKNDKDFESKYTLLEESQTDKKHKKLRNIECNEFSILDKIGQLRNLSPKNMNVSLTFKSGNGNITIQGPFEKQPNYSLRQFRMAKNYRTVTVNQSLESTDPSKSV